MKHSHPHTDAMRFLTEAASLSEAQIDAMTPAEAEAYLSENGIDVPKLKGELNGLKAQLSGQAALAEARRRRLAKKAAPVTDLSQFSQEYFMTALRDKFGSIEAMPIAARNFKAMQRSDWEALYIDHILRRP